MTSDQRGPDPHWRDRERTPLRPASGRPGRPDQARRPRRDDEVRRPVVDAPPLPEDLRFAELDPAVRQRLRTLSKENAEDVGKHLLMAGYLLDEDPELAYRHAQVAVARGGRVDVVREAAALTAYATGRYAEALRELRTVRRLSGSTEHLALEADCERGLGRPERAIDIAKSPLAARLTGEAKAELELVIAGARRDMGDLSAAIAILESIEGPTLSFLDRVSEALADAYRAAGRDADAEAAEAAILERAKGHPHQGEGYPVVVYDLDEDDDAGPDVTIPGDEGDAEPKATNTEVEG